MYRLVPTLSLIALALTMSLPAAGVDRDDIEAGVFAGLGFPDDYGEGPAALRPDDDLLFGVRGGIFFNPQWSIELSLQRFSGETRSPALAGRPDLDTDSLRVNALFHFLPGERLRPFVTVGAGLERHDVDGLLDEDDTGFNIGGGLRYRIGERCGLRLDGRYVTTDIGGPLDDQQNDVEAAVGAYWSFGGGKASDGGRKTGGDTDRDGVSDRRDRCPDTPRGARVNRRGCAADGDRDGVPDGIDRCPGTPAFVPVDRKGCPRDTDGDGVVDGQDACPETPRGARVDARGCRTDGNDAGRSRDSDGDGVVDGSDRCPNTPRGTSVDLRGCAVDSDSDGDGVPDGADRCPGTPAGTLVDDRGCKRLFEQGRRKLVLEGVRFDLNSARLTPEAEAILDRVALSLIEWGDIRVEVGGHTDSLGSENTNLRLSSRRAETVVRYLTSRGVDSSRLKGMGYGEGWPIADNAAEAGRRKNRRVELKRLD